MTCLGSVPNSPFDPLAEALPLAEKPHLLEPDQCRYTREFILIKAHFSVHYQIIVIMSIWKKSERFQSQILLYFALQVINTGGG